MNIKNNPEIIEGFTKAINRALKYVHEHVHILNAFGGYI